MKPESRLAHGILLGVLISAGTIHAEDFAPGVQHVCVPNADGDGWDCGTVDNPPAATATIEAASSEPAPAPPPFLANPEGTSGPTYLHAPPEHEIIAADAPVEEPIAAEAAAAAEPAAIAESAAAMTPEVAPIPSTPSPLPEPTAAVAEPLTDATPVEEIPATATTTASDVPATSEPAATAVATETSAVVEETSPSAAQSLPEAEPAAATAAVVASEPVPATQATTPAVAAAAEPVEPATEVTTPPTPVHSSAALSVASLQGARAFAALTPSRYTLQLAYAQKPDGIPQLIQQLGIDPRQCYLLRVRRDGGDWWVLAWGDHADAAAAKRALAQLRPVGGMSAVWPRRISYLQGEYRP